MNGTPIKVHSAPVMELTDVTVGSLRHPRLVVLAHANWTLSAGDYWAVGGLHSSGKSDFLAMLAGLMPPAGGTYRLFGREMIAGFLDEMLPERMRVGLVFDGGQLINNLSVAQNVALPLQFHGLSSGIGERVEQLLDWMELTPMAERLPAAISRGWQQRVGLARALALQPEVLLLDNPLSGMDPQHMTWWLNTLDQLAKGPARLDGRPITLVATGDDLRPWRTRARRFAMLRNKELVVLGERGDLGGPIEMVARDLLAT